MIDGTRHGTGCGATGLIVIRLFMRDNSCIMQYVAIVGPEPIEYKMRTSPRGALKTIDMYIAFEPAFDALRGSLDQYGDRSVATGSSELRYRARSLFVQPQALPWR